MGETEAHFAERAIQSLNQIMYRSFEDRGKKFFATCENLFFLTSCRKNLSIETSPRDV